MGREAAESQRCLTTSSPPDPSPATCLGRDSLRESRESQPRPPPPRVPSAPHCPARLRGLQGKENPQQPPFPAAHTEVSGLLAVGGARLPRCPVSVTARQAPAGAGRLRSHPPATHSAAVCSSGRTPSGWLQPLGLRPAKSQSGAEARTPRALCAPASPFKVGRLEERATAPYLRHRERLAVLQAPLQGEAPGRPPLQLHRDVLEGPRPALHPRLGWAGAAGLLFRGDYGASAPSSSATIVLQRRAAPLRLLSRLETLRQLVSSRRK